MTIVDDVDSAPVTGGAAGLALAPAAEADGAVLLAILENLADQTRAYVNATRADSTRRAYASDWRDFLSWCEAHHLQALPAAPESVALYITQLAKRRRVATVQRRLAAISQAH